MEQLVILIIIGAISLINWLLQKSAEHKKNRRGGGDTPVENTREADFGWDAPGETETGETGGAGQEEQMRRFFEALGLPTPQEQTQGPVITPSFEIDPPPLPIPAPVAVPRATHREKPGVVSAPSFTEPAKPTLRENREMRELAERFAANELDAASTTGTQAAFRNLLSDPHGARQAIILQEILNPPRALRPYSA